MRRGPGPRARRHILTLAFCSLLLACGGGRDSDSDTGAPEADHWLASLVRSGSGAELRAWDPAAPSRAAHAWASDLADTGQSMLTTQAWVVDAESGERTLQGDVLALQVADGRLYRVMLLGGRSHARVQVSALDRVCGLDRVEADDATGTTAWVSVHTRNDAGRCEDHALVHTSMNAATAASAWTGGPLRTALRDPEGRSQWLLAAGPSGVARRSALYALSVRDGSATRLVSADATEFHDGEAEWLAPGTPGSGQGWVRVGGAVRQLSWTADSVALAAPVFDTAYSIWSCGGDCAPLPDGGGGLYYLHSGDVVRHLAADGTLTDLAYLDVEDNVDRWVLTDHHLVWSSTDYAYDSVTAVPLAGGDARRLAHLGVMGTDDYLSLLGAQGDTVLLRSVITEAGESQPRRRFRLVAADGGGSQTLTGQALAPVADTRQPWGRPPALQALLLCPAGVSSCAGQAVVAHTLGDGREQAMGTLSGLVDDEWGAVGLRAGLPAGLAGYHAGSPYPDVLWQVTVGTAGSLRRVWSD